MGNVIRFIFKTNYIYSKFDQFKIVLGLFGIGLWAYILINLLMNL